MENLINTITLGDSFALIKQIDNQSIDLVLTDPPYFINGSHGFKGEEWDSSKALLNSELVFKIENKILSKQQAKKEYEKAVKQYFVKMTEMLIPKIKNDGSMIFFNRRHNLHTIIEVLENDKYTLDEWMKTEAYKSQPEPSSKWYTMLLEWKKTNPNVLITENERSEYALIAINMAVSNPNKITQISEYWNDNLHSDNLYYATSPADSKTIFYDKAKHVSPKPISLWRNLLKRFSEPNDLVLDIYSGSGTTALVAEDLGRNYIAFEYDDNQAQRSLERLTTFQEEMPHSAFLFDD